MSKTQSSAPALLNWKLEATSWNLETLNWNLEALNWKLETLNWKLEALNWKLGVEDAQEEQKNIKAP